jgi:hypothetical protein
MTDPVIKLALLRDIDDSRELERQLGNIQGGRPIVSIYRRLREKAADALAAMVFLNIMKEPAQVVRDLMALQAEVKRFDDFIGELRAMIARGDQAVQQLQGTEQDELLDILAATPGGEETAIRLGLVDEVPNDA